MTQENQNQSEQDASPMAIGRESARAMLNEAIESDAEDPQQAAYERAVQQYQQAHQQVERAKRMAEASQFAVTVLQAINTLSEDGSLEVSTPNPAEETAGVDDQSGEVVEGIGTPEGPE